MDKYYGGYNSRNNDSCNRGSYNANNCSRNYNESCNGGKNCSDNAYARNYSENSANKNYSRNYSENNNGDNCSAKFHLHEVQGSVQVTCDNCENHNHRFATVSCEPITMKNGNHCHQVTFRTDTYEGHYHEFTGRTTEDFDVCEGHVHYLEGKTSEQAGHCHEFKVITHIENPTED